MRPKAWRRKTHTQTHTLTHSQASITHQSLCKPWGAFPVLLLRDRIYCDIVCCNNIAFICHLPAGRTTCLSPTTLPGTPTFRRWKLRQTQRHNDKQNVRQASWFPVPMRAEKQVCCHRTEPLLHCRTNWGLSWTQKQTKQYDTNKMNLLDASVCTVFFVKQFYQTLRKIVVK